MPSNVTTRTLINTGDPFSTSAGVPLAGATIIMQLVDPATLRPVSPFDAVSGEFIASTPIPVVLNTSGEFPAATALWPNDRGDVATVYRVSSFDKNVIPFLIRVDTGATPLTLVQARAAMGALTPQQTTLIESALDSIAVSLAAVQALAVDLSAVDGHATGSLTAQQATSTIIDNVGQVAAADLTLPAAAAGMNFLMQVGEAGANLWRIRAAATDKIYLNGVAGADNGYVGITPTAGAYLAVWSFKTGANTWDWYAVVGNGNWIVS